MSGCYKKIVLSGAITGHEEEAAAYFGEACKIVLQKYPLAEIFNPAQLMKLNFTYRDCMIVCLSRIKGWATDIVYVKNDFFSASKGAEEERLAARAMGLEEHSIIAGKLVDDGRHAWVQ